MNTPSGSDPGLPFSFGTIVLGTGALLLVAFLVAGFLLPGTWQASASLRVGAPPDSVFVHLDAPSAWRQWSALPDTGLTLEGPERGAGARMRWHHPEFGSGSFEIVEAQEGTVVRYLVLVEDGAMRTEGRVALAEVDGGTRVVWTESGDFGWNPLMGYWALFMGRAQGRELAKSLISLGRAVEHTRESEAPADSGSTGA